MTTPIEPLVYEPAPEIRLIIKRFANARKNEAWAKMQKELLEHYLPTMQDAVAERAKNTLAFLNDVIAGKEFYGRY